jgi:hypothetical protein
VAAPELTRAGQRELEPQDTWWPRSCPGLGSGSWSRRARGGPGATPGWQRELEPQGTWRPRSCPGLAAGAGAAEHVVALKLPRAGSRSWDRRTRGGPGLGSGSQTRRTRGDAEAHLSREARLGATASVAARGYTPFSLA